jgi:hypothetical protein
MRCRRIELPAWWPLLRHVDHGGEISARLAIAFGNFVAASDGRRPLARLIDLGSLGSFWPRDASNTGAASKLWRVMPTRGAMHRRSAVCG